MEDFDPASLIKEQRLESEYCPVCMTRHHPQRACDPMDLDRVQKWDD